MAAPLLQRYFIKLRVCIGAKRCARPMLVLGVDYWLTA